jgi:hypothetical protein
MATVSFRADIFPLFEQYRGSMLWRLDLTNYDDVKANAALIYDNISDGMPPAPYASLTKEQIGLFQAWIAQGCRP